MSSSTKSVLDRNSYAYVAVDNNGNNFYVAVNLLIQTTSARCFEMYTRAVDIKDNDTMDTIIAKTRDWVARHADTSKLLSSIVHAGPQAFREHQMILGDQFSERYSTFQALRNETSANFGEFYKNVIRESGEFAGPFERDTFVHAFHKLVANESVEMVLIQLQNATLTQHPAALIRDAALSPSSSNKPGGGLRLYLVCVKTWTYGFLRATPTTKMAKEEEDLPEEEEREEEREEDGVPQKTAVPNKNRREDSKALVTDIPKATSDAYDRAFDAFAKKDYDGSIAAIDQSASFIRSSDNDGLIPYPDLRDPAFNEKIRRKYEFARHFRQVNHMDEDGRNDPCDRTAFRLTQHQKTLWAYMAPHTPYNSILLFHGTGTGKTCSAITIADQYIANNLVSQQLLDSRKRHLVICSQNLVPHFKSQIFNPKSGSAGCTADAYTRDLPPDMEPEDMASAVEHAISRRWEFMGFQRFVNVYDNLEAVAKNNRKKTFDELLDDAFSHRVIIIDEAHNARVSGDLKKQVPPRLERMLKTCDGIHLILLTATPMFDDAREVIFLINMLRWNDKREAIKESDIFDKDSRVKDASKLLAASTGYVSFQMAENPRSFPVRLPPSINKDPNIFNDFRSITRDLMGRAMPATSRDMEQGLELIACEMGSLQQKAYLDHLRELVDAQKEKETKSENRNKRKEDRKKTKGEEVLVEVQDDDEDIDGSEEDEVPSSATGKFREKYQALMQVSNVSYPVLASQKGYGKSGFDECFAPYESGSSFVYKHRNRPQFLDKANLQKHSGKMHRIIDYINHSKGIVFVYSSYLYSGLIPLAIALEHRGFRRFHKSDNTNILGNLSRKDATGLEYILLTGDKERFSRDNNAEIQALLGQVADDTNGPQMNNIKVVLASSAATEGFDFKCIREVHILEPWHNFSKLEQAFGRAIRHCSHIHLPVEERNVTLYRHISTVGKNVGADKDIARNETIDMRRYRRAWVKNVAIQNVVSMLRENAMDRLLMGEARETKVPTQLMTSQGRRVTWDVVHKRYTHHMTAKDLDYSTFDSYFYKIDVQECKANVQKAFQDHVALTYAALHELLGGDGIVLTRVLWKTLMEMTEAQDTFLRAEQPGYLITRGDKYIFQPLKMPKHASIEERLVSEPLSTYLLRIPVSWLDKITPKGALVLKATTSSTSTSSGTAVSSLKQLADRVASMQSLMDRIASKYKRSVETKCAIDYVIDRLSCNEQKAMLKAVYGGKGEDGEIAARLKELPNVLVLRSGSIDGTYFVSYAPNPIKPEFVFSKWDAQAKDWKPCPLDEAALGVSLRSLHSTMVESWKSRKVLAYIDYEKGVPEFKVIYRDNRSLLDTKTDLKTNIGTQCSNLAKGNRIRLVSHIRKEGYFQPAYADSPAYLSAFMDACLHYEWFMRYQSMTADRSDEKMMRPFERLVLLHFSGMTRRKVRVEANT